MIIKRSQLLFNLILIFILVMLCGCSSGSASKYSDYGYSDDIANNRFDDDQSTGFTDMENPYNSNSGHSAGYDWAEENDLQVGDDCGGNSNSFIEGCEEYLEQLEEVEGYQDDTLYDTYEEGYDNYVDSQQN